MKRCPFFLIEVLVATLLVGVFAYLSIHGAFRLIYQQRKLLIAIEDSIKRDIRLMNAIEESWNKAENFLVKGKKSKDGVGVSSQVANNGKYYLLKLKEKKPEKTFCYLVTIHDL